jgi:hypothetical protein
MGHALSWSLWSGLLVLDVNLCFLSVVPSGGAFDRRVKRTSLLKPGPHTNASHK